MSERDDAQKVMRYDAERIVDEVIQERVDKAIYQLIGKRVKEATESLYDYVDNVVADIKTPNSPRGEVRYFGGSLIHNRQDSSSIDFTAAGQGATASDVQTELRRIIYPEQFGCKGDGVTDDSSNMALAATAATGKILKLTPGKTYLMANVNIPASTPETVVDMTGAFVKSVVLGSKVGSPIFNVTGTGRVLFIGGEVDGQKTSQPADGFSDSFNTGANSTGRAYRAAIKADAVVNTGVSRVKVVGTRFTGVYGACVATQDVPTVIVRDCHLKTCNFELAFAYHSAASNLDFQLVDNIIDTAASGDATVNADGAVCSGYRRVTVTGNHVYNIERTICKVEGGNNVIIANNVIDTNTINNFPGVQVECTTALPVTRCVISGNTIFNAGMGIELSVSSGTPDTVVITGNNVYTTTGTSLAHGVVVNAAKNLIVSGNNCIDIKGHGIYLSDTCTRAKISGNNLYGQGISTQDGILCNAGTANFGTLAVENNHVEHFNESTSADGVLTLTRSSTFVFPTVIVRGNTLLSAASTNRGLRVASDIITAGVCADNYIDGQIETASSGFLMKNNTVTGVVTWPSAMLTFTPSLLFGGASASMTYGTQVGRYRIVDKRLFFEIQIILTAKGVSTGSATVSGLPLAAVNSNGYLSPCSISFSNLTFTGVPSAYVGANASSVTLITAASAGANSALSDTAFADTTTLRLQGSYEIAGLTS